MSSRVLGSLDKRESRDPGEATRAERCRRVLAIAGLSELWTLDGPARDAYQVLVREAALPSFESLVVIAAWTIWVDADLSPVLTALGWIDGGLALRVGHLAQGVALT